MSWTPYELDRLALSIVLTAKKRDQDLAADRREREGKPKDKTSSTGRESSLGSLNQIYKMRAACSYGLERFWGEHLRLAHASDPVKPSQAEKQDKDKHKEDRAKAAIIIDTWLSLVGVMATAGIDLPNTVIDLNKGKHPQPLSADQISQVSHHIWNLPTMEAQICLSVLTCLCDALVWWTQRLKGGKPNQTEES
jgi:hypothetical protein